VRVVPSLAAGQAIVADKSRCYAVVRSDSRIEVATTTNDAWHRGGSNCALSLGWPPRSRSPTQAARAPTIGLWGRTPKPHLVAAVASTVSRLATDNARAGVRFGRRWDLLIILRG